MAEAQRRRELLSGTAPPAPDEMAHVTGEPSALHRPVMAGPGVDRAHGLLGYRTLLRLGARASD
jgi:hypothetical protein